MQEGQKKMKPGSSSLKIGRNAMEKKRRMQMNHLFSILSSLIFTQRFKTRIASHVLLERAMNYIEGLKKNIKELQRRKEQLMGGQTSVNKHSMEALSSPVVVVEEMGSTLAVKLITGFNKNFMLHQVLTVLEEENVEVLSVNYSTMVERIMYTIHSQAIWSRIGIETPRVQERLKELVS